MKVIRISLSADGEQADGDSRQPAWSPDGQQVVFESNATNLVPEDRNNAWDVFIAG